MHLERDHQQRNRDHSKQFAKKINEINFPKIENLRATSNDSRFPKQGHAHTKWFYGRFAIGQVRQNVDQTTAPNYNIKRNALGNEYLRESLQISDNHMVNIIARRKKQREVAIEKEKDGYESQTPKSTNKFDYLRQMKAKRRASDPNCANKNLYRSVELPPKSLHGGFWGLKDEPAIFNDDQAKALLSQIDKFDNMARRKEERIRNGADRTPKDAGHKKSFTMQDIPDSLDDYYIKSIKAKLELLEVVS